MPIALLIVAVAFVVVGFNGTQSDLACLLKQDFGTGKGSFLYWLAVIVILGSLGYVEKLRPVADAFLVLLIVVLFLTAGKGVFSQLNTTFGSTNTTNTGGGVGTSNLLQQGQSLLNNTGLTP